MVIDEISIRLHWLFHSLIGFIPYFIGGLGIGSIVLALGVFIARYLFWQWLLPVEKEILLFFKARANSSLTTAMVAMTFLAQGQVTIPIVVAIGGSLIYARESAAALVLAMNLGGSWLLNGIFKSFFRRQRPNLWASPYRPMDYSYPSGHSMSAISFYGLLALYADRFSGIPLAIAVGSAVSISVLVGFSRVYLGAHWPTDVLSGWLAGLIWLIACIYGLSGIGAI